MIKPFSAIHGGTLVANPRRKRRKVKAGRKHGFRALSRNPSHRRKRHAGAHKRKARNPAHAFARMHHKKHARKNPARRHGKRRNPGMDMGGINLVELGLGSAGTIALSSVVQALVDKYAPASIKSMPGAAALVPALVAAGAFYGHKKASGTLKGALKFVVITSAFEAVNQLVGAQIKSTIAGLLPGATGGYYQASGHRVGGVYLPSPQRATGGVWLQTPPATAGAFPQGKPMFGVV